jgi:hypothetical protein
LILDTNFPIDLAEGHENAAKKAEEVKRDGVPIRVPKVVICELWISVGHGSRTEENRKKYESVLRSLGQVDLRERIAKRAGRMESELAASDTNAAVGPVDAIIAATALELDEPIVTDDRNDFLDGLKPLYPDLRVELFS